uniref:Uncharacterized protein n=1 Tax=Leersia perrieri TaxID=77586 RepID=A0A0D9WND5_9ORYZ
MLSPSEFREKPLIPLYGGGVSRVRVLRTEGGLCTRGYILGVKADFRGRWLCGLCSEAVRDEAAKLGRKRGSHVILRQCCKCRKNPAFRVADGMRQMLLRRRS